MPQIYRYNESVHALYIYLSFIHKKYKGFFFLVFFCPPTPKNKFWRSWECYRPLWEEKYRLKFTPRETEQDAMVFVPRVLSQPSVCQKSLAKQGSLIREVRKCRNNEK